METLIAVVLAAVGSGLLVTPLSRVRWNMKEWHSELSRSVSKKPTRSSPSHRHHKPVVMHKFSIGCINLDTGLLCGAVICGRPVSRGCDHVNLIEVNRCVTDGTANACSFLYGAAAKAARVMGYEFIQTYTLQEEAGASLRGAGWEEDGLTRGGEWERADGEKRRTDQPNTPKRRWRRRLNPSIEFDRPSLAEAADTHTLWTDDGDMQ